jgi:hypothetical protein
MKFVIRRTPLGFETYLWLDGALADLRDLMSQVEVRHPLALRPRPLMPPRDTPILANVAYVTLDEKLLAVVH